MTEQDIRQSYVRCAETYLGAKQGGAKHKDIIAAYNSYTPHPRGYVMTMTAPWCAAFVSAVAILTDLSDIIPIECSCGEQIKLWQKLDRWEENDAYIPKRGDIVYYDWQDSGKGDCTGAADHVGIVTNVVDDDILVLEGNKGGMVAYRHISVNGIYIRGFGLPDFASKATATDTPMSKYGYCTVELPILQYGKTGESVRTLQTLLNMRNEMWIDVDGSFGGETLKAVKEFQNGVKIVVDGSVGPITWRRLING